MFASKSGGYWRSEDLAKWEYIPCTTIPTMEAPPRYNSCFFMVIHFTLPLPAEIPQFIRMLIRKKDAWQEVDTKFGSILNMIRHSLKMMMEEFIFIGDVRM